MRFATIAALLWSLNWMTSVKAAEGLAPSTGKLAVPDRARVVRASDTEAMAGFEPRAEVVRRMVERALLSFTGKKDVAAAWLSLVTVQDRVGIKVVSGPGRISGTRVAVVDAMVNGLLLAGLPPKNIIVWDRHLPDLRQAGYLVLAERYGIRVEGASETRYDDAAFYESNPLGKLIWNDHEFGKTGENIGKKSFVSKLVSQELTKIVLVSPLLNHNEGGVHGQLMSLALGSIDNSLRFESDASKLAVAVPEIFALPQLGDKVALCVVDALICQYQGEQLPLLHYSAHKNQVWMSKDPVALDALSIREIERQRQAAKVPSPRLNWDLYQNASLLQLGIQDPRQIQTVDAEP